MKLLCLVCFLPFFSFNQWNGKAIYQDEHTFFCNIDFFVGYSDTSLNSKPYFEPHKNGLLSARIFYNATKFIDSVHYYYEDSKIALRARYFDYKIVGKFIPPDTSYKWPYHSSYRDVDGKLIQDKGKVKEYYSKLNKIIYQGAYNSQLRPDIFVESFYTNGKVRSIEREFCSNDEVMRYDRFFDFDGNLAYEKIILNNETTKGTFATWNTALDTAILKVYNHSILQETWVVKLDSLFQIEFLTMKDVNSIFQIEVVSIKDEIKNKIHRNKKYISKKLKSTPLIFFCNNLIILNERGRNFIK